LREPLTFTDRGYAILYFLEAVDHLRGLPAGDVAITARAETAVQEAAHGQQAVSTRLAEISNTPCRDWLDLCGVVG
jgi:hypothetical protein